MVLLDNVDLAKNGYGEAPFLQFISSFENPNLTLLVPRKAEKGPMNSPLSVRPISESVH